MSGTLYIVATPIGNLADITFRAVDILTCVSCIVCEDTRETRKITERYNISTRLFSMNARTEESKIHEIQEMLERGEDVAYVSDAGTPGISDPGVRLVATMRHAGIPVCTIPGPSALTAALSIAGVPTNTFTFLGFLPQKKGRQTILKDLQNIEHTVVCYESPHRIMKLLDELGTHVPLRKVTLARELTKMFEEVFSGTPKEIKALLEAVPVKQKGEFVVMISA